MFATLLGSLPRPPLGEDAPLEAFVEATLRAQEAAGLEPLTDGGQAAALPPLDAWSLTSSLTHLRVKQAVLGPYSAALEGTGAERHMGAGALAGGRGPTPGQDAAVRRERTLTLAEDRNVALRRLVVAGCPLIEIHEPAAVSIGTDEAERALFREAHARLLDGVEGVHLSLAITGGNADAAGLETLLAAPFASLAVDLIAGPDNWRLVTRLPGDRGVVCGALPATAGSDDGPETLLWAAGYAASTGGRGPDRVGLATASSLAALPWEVAVAKLGRLGEALRIAGLPLDQRRAAVDPRAVDARSAALGRSERPPATRPGRNPPARP
jgi:hypothetical protein